MLPVHWLSVAVLGILPWPLVNLVSIPQFRREYRCYATMLLNLVYMIRIASEDLSGFLVWAIKLLIDNPAWAERLALAACDPRHDADALAAMTIREVLRLERSEFIFRKAISDIDYQGFRIPAGWIVRICIRDGHRDPGAFPDPATFDPQRFAGRTLSNEVYSPLGIGTHACIGGRVIDGVAGAFLKIWTGSYRVTVHRDGPREYGRSHWQPSAKLRVSLRER